MQSFFVFESNIDFNQFHAVHFAGMKKTNWITWNVEPDIQHLSLDRGRFQSNFVVRPRDLNRLLANFQSSLQEITIIATEPTSLPSDDASEIGGKALELRSYVDPTKGNWHILPWLFHKQDTDAYLFNCREWFLTTHSTVDRSYRRVDRKSVV